MPVEFFKVKLTDLYTIPYKGLKDGRHEFQFEINDGFFSGVEECEIESAALKANVDADKNGNLMRLLVTIEGEVGVACDRCLATVLCPITYEGNVWVKNGNVFDADEEGNDELIIVPAEQGELNLWQYLYDSIALSLPIQRIHPGKPGTKNGCDAEVIRKLNEHLVDETEPEVDPRWNALLKLKGNIE